MSSGSLSLSFTFLYFPTSFAVNKIWWYCLIANPATVNVNPVQFALEFLAYFGILPKDFLIVIAWLSVFIFRSAENAFRPPGVVRLGQQSIKGYRAGDLLDVPGAEHFGADGEVGAPRDELPEGVARPGVPVHDSPADVMTGQDLIRSQSLRSVKSGVGIISRSGSLSP